MINVHRLNFSYPRSNFDLKIDRLKVNSGCATAVVGPSGSGKTTFLHLIAGILAPNSGTIRIDDSLLTALSDADRRRFRLQNIGMIFQDFELIEYLNVIDNVLLPCRIGKVIELTPETRKRAEGLLTHVGLQQHLKKSVTRLSQGERQRVSICRALLASPAILLADEPTGNLDPVSSDQILKLLLASVHEHNTTLVMVTHDHSLLHRFDETVDFAQFLIPATTTNRPTPGESA